MSCSPLSSSRLKRGSKARQPPHQVVLGLGHVGVVSAQPALVDLQGTAVVILHLLVLALILAQQGQVVQLLGHIRVVLPQDLNTQPFRRLYLQERTSHTYSFTCELSWAMNLSDHMT